MIQTREELFLAESGINVKEQIETAYTGQIELTELLREFATKFCPAELPKLKIINIRKGEGVFQSKILYAQVVYVSSGDLKCSATLDFILKVMFPQRDNIENYEDALNTFIDFHNKIIDGHFKNRCKHKKKTLPYLAPVDECEECGELIRQ